MPTPTYDFISSTVLASPTNSVSLSGFPNTYRDLIISAELKNASNQSELRIKINNATDSYGEQIFEGSSGFVNAIDIGLNGGLGVISNNVTTASSQKVAALEIQLFDYAQTDRAKMVMTHAGVPAEGQALTVMQYNSTNVVTSTQLSIASGADFASGSKFTIYGVIA